MLSLRIQIFILDNMFKPFACSSHFRLLRPRPDCDPPLWAGWWWKGFGIIQCQCCDDLTSHTDGSHLAAEQHESCTPASLSSLSLRGGGGGRGGGRSSREGQRLAMVSAPVFNRNCASVPGGLAQVDTRTRGRDSHVDGYRGLVRCATCSWGDLSLGHVPKQGRRLCSVHQWRRCCHRKFVRG